MIFNKQIKKNQIISKILELINKIIYFIGLFLTGSIIFFLIYYNTSGLKHAHSPTQFIKTFNSKILDNYLGIDLSKSFDYFNIIGINILSKFSGSELENVYLELSQKTILGLEMQRNLRKENGGEIPKSFIRTYPANIKYNKNNYKVKIRSKGVRNIHWMSKDKMSYKIDLIGDKRLWGLEEFAMQKPITRNYTYEYLFHKLLNHVGLTSIKYFFINLYINDQNLGVYAIEESFSKELIERQSLRNGPIFGLSEEFGEVYPDVKFDIYSSNYWISQFPDLTEQAFSILNDIKNQKDHINNHFNLEKWAKYFAIMDLTGSYHGSMAKSVKFFYNPTTALFEPIGYDLHKGAGNFQNFILLDFLQETKPNCLYLCAHEYWFERFFKSENKSLNSEFLDYYIKYLKKYSDKNFIDQFLKINNLELKKYNYAIYQDNSKTDKINRVGLGYFLYDEELLYDRANLINQRIKSINLDSVTISIDKNLIKYEDYQATNFPVKVKFKSCKNKADEKDYYFAGKMEFAFYGECEIVEIFDSDKKFKKINLNKNIILSSNLSKKNKNKFKNLSEKKNILEISNNKYLIDKNILIDDFYKINKNETFIFDKKIEINIINNSTLFVEGNLIFKGDNNQFTKVISSDKSGSIIFNNNKYIFQNILFENLSAPNLNNYILYGGINFINSDIKLSNIYIKNSQNEDAINLINSKSIIKNIFFENIKADALDIDFGNIEFKNIQCKKILNDCVDISGSNVQGSLLYAENTKDKVISIGENSRVNINNIDIKNNNVGIAVKDGSSATLSKVKFDNNNYDVIVFNKKKEFEKPELKINEPYNLNKKKILQSKGTSLFLDNKILTGQHDDNYINSIIY